MKRQILPQGDSSLQQFPLPPPQRKLITVEIPNIADSANRLSSSAR
jgi:hypothetical protein